MTAATSTSATDPSADRSQLVELRLNNAPAALPRLLLAFSRRRLHVSELVMLDEREDAGAMVRIGFELDTGRLETFLRQLRRMVDVHSVEWVGQPKVFQSVAA